MDGVIKEVLNTVKSICDDMLLEPHVSLTNRKRGLESGTCVYEVYVM